LPEMIVGGESTSHFAIFHYAETKTISERPLLVVMFDEELADLFETFWVHPEDVALA